MQKEKHYIPAVDALRIISILAVIFIHTTTRTLEASFFDLRNLPITFFINQVLRFAVPLFFIISGFVLELNFHLHESYLAYFKKRINRIFLPYLFWSAIYYFFVYKVHTENFFYAVIKGDASYQLYFIPALLIFYFLFPFIHNFYKFFNSKWLLIVLGILQLSFLYFDYYVRQLTLFYPITIALLNFFVFYLGIAIANNHERFISFAKKWKLILFISLLAFAVYINFEGLTYYLKTHNYLAFYSSWRPSIFIYTLLIGSFLYYLFDRNFKYTIIIKTLSRLSFFVFFIHVIILEVVWYAIGKNLFALTNGKISHQLWYDPLYFLAVTIVSFSIAFIVHKIPYLSKISG